jgi:Cof subfamily protein (haloacid dehalogenase superfamily)
MTRPRRSEKYKLLAVDLDGTLLDSTGRPHAKDVRALRALAASGVHVTIVTGRLYSGTRPSAAAIGLRGPVACADGSHIVHVEGNRTALHLGIRGEHAFKLRDSLARHGAATFLFAQDLIVHDDSGAMFLGYVRTWSEEVQRAERVHEHELWSAHDGVTAVVALGTSEQISQTVEDVQRDLSATTQVTMFPIRRMQGLWGMVARAMGGTKGSALEWMARHHACSIDQTVAIGDWLNDIPMLAAAGRSFAMGQAPLEVQQAADVVLEEDVTTGGGIARVIEELFGVLP